MPLDVLIATPSGPFGELIRLTLEADPDFHCLLVDNGSEIWQTLQEKVYQAVIFDCSFLEPEPRQVFLRLKDDFPEVALLLVPPENRTDINPLKDIQAEGFIPRPFDASVLAEQVRAVIDKKGNQVVEPELTVSPRKSDSWWDAFQAGIHETAASNGMIVQNGMVVACTPETSTALQQQVTASIARFWSPADSTDLMRYVKDLVTGQEWMMYASSAAENAVLALLFLPQTPITKVRSQTLKLARDISALMEKPTTAAPRIEPGYLETSEPPRLHEILGETPAEEPTRIIKNHFPVEWFKEADLPEFNTPVQPAMERFPEDEQPIQQDSPSFEELNELLSKVTSAQQNSANISVEREAESEGESPNIPVVPSGESSQPEPVDPPVESIPTLPENDFDLGTFQPVSLLSSKTDVTELDDIQPISLEAPVPASTPLNVEITQPFAHMGQNEEFASEILPKPAVELSEPASLEPAVASDNAIFPEEPDETPCVSQVEELAEMPVASLLETRTNGEGDSEGIPGTSPLLERFNLNPEPVKEHPSEAVEEVETVEPETAASMPASDDLYERMNQLESASKQEARETITVALIPRSENMILQRQISGVLNQTVSRLCLAFNWELDNLTIRPTFMQWTVTIPVSLSPEDMISIVKKETSLELIKALSADFGLTDKDDFWATESMSAVGRDFVPSIHWQNFILRRKSHEIA